MKKTGLYMIPFDKKGNQLHYAEQAHGDQEWKNNDDFYAHLSFSEYRRGRSAAYFVFKHPDGREVTMFLKEFEGIADKMVAGVLSGTFRFIKRGANYGVLPVRITESSVLLKSKRFTELDEILGSTRGATDCPVHISQDDSTHDYIVTLGYQHARRRYYSGSSLAEAIGKAAIGEKKEEG